MRKARRGSQRGVSGRKAGKQPGAPGATLRQIEDPDSRVVYEPGCCSGCGGGLADAPVVGQARRQVFDLPEPAIVVVEHVAQARRCACGTTTAAAFPAGVDGPAVWGPRVRAWCVYLQVYQHIPYARTAELLREMGAAVSVGFVASQCTLSARKLAGWMIGLRRRLTAEPVLHADETSGRVNGALWWLHVVSNRLLTLLVAHSRRGMDAVDEIGVIAARDTNSTLVHDRAAMYWNYGTGHALCAAHLLRDLAGVAELARHTTWTAELRSVLLNAKTVADEARQAGRLALEGTELAAINQAYATAVHHAMAIIHGEPTTKPERAATNLACAFFDYEPEILAFTRNLAVPFDNNQAERDLRMTKIHQRVSGGWRAPHGIQTFATIRSYIETGRKHGHNPLHLLTQLYTTQPWPIPTG